MDPLTIAMLVNTAASITRQNKAGVRSQVGLPEPTSPGIYNAAGIYGTLKGVTKTGAGKPEGGALGKPESYSKLQQTAFAPEPALQIQGSTPSIDKMFDQFPIEWPQ